MFETQALKLQCNYSKNDFAGKVKKPAIYSTKEGRLYNISIHIARKIYQQEHIVLMIDCLLAAVFQS